ncbi:MAG: helix-hairpin-helix domain-containing protein [Microgenomates group bacterium]
MINKKVAKKLKKYWLEIIFISIAGFITTVSLFFYLKTKEDSQTPIITQTKATENQTKFKKEIWVDVSGSVNNPGLYRASNNTRLKDIIDQAGGLSDQADKGFFYRNFNLARFVSDQEKIYIPSYWEVQNGYFVENPQLINNSQANLLPFNNENSTNLVSINNASIDELDTLPGIGKTLAQKIINNRPFQSLEELLTKKIINQSTFEKIKDLISL